MERADWTFEEQWSQALGNAEVTPPEQVWVAIDGSLANDQVVSYKKQADFYRWVAAACLFLITFGGAYFWMSGSTNVSQDLAESEEVIPKEPNLKGGESMTTAAAILDEEKKDEVASVHEQDQKTSKALPTLVSKETAKKDLPMATPIIEPKTGSFEVKSGSRYAVQESAFSTLASKSTALDPVVEPWQTDHLYGVARTWETVDELVATSPLWAGISFGAGAFDPGFGAGSEQDMVFASQDGFTAESAQVQSQPTSPQYASGQSVAGGLNVGKKFTKRLVLSSGLHYSAFNTGSASTQVVADASRSYALTSETNDAQLESALSSGDLRYAGEQVQLANEYQYLTIPIKAGYVLLDSKFNITLNTGLSSNILVDSKLVSEGSDQSLNNDFGTSSSYQNVYFNFLTSVEFGYVFKQHYQFLLEPNYNQAITEFTNSNHTDNAKPRNLGVAIGFRYNF